MSGHHLKILQRVKIMQILESSQLLSMNLWIGLITRQSRRDQYWQVRKHKTNTMKETRSWTEYTFRVLQPTLMTAEVIYSF